MNRVAAVALLVIGLCAEASAEPVRHGDYVAVGTTNGTRWHLAPLSEGKGTTLNLRLIPTSSTNGQVFVIEKVTLENGTQVHDGDYVRLRGINSSYSGGRDPYLMAEGSSVDRVNVADKRLDLGWEDPTILFIRSSEPVVSFGTPFRVRGTKGESWFVPGSYRSMISFVQGEWRAEWFAFEEPNKQMMRDDNQIRDRSRPPGPLDQFMGWLFNIFSPNEKRAPEPPKKGPGSGGGGVPGTPGAQPTIRVEEPGSAINIYIANNAGRSFTCTLGIYYQYDDFGELQKRTDTHVEAVSANAKEYRVWRLQGSYSKLELSEPVRLSCQ